MATKILFSPKFPKPIHDIAVEMAPPGFELVTVDSSSPQFLDAAKDVEYFMGFGRNPLSHDFYAAAKNIKLVQLISAGYNTLDLEAARRALDAGFTISLAGIVSFPKAEELREVARFVPLDRLLIETDSPFLAPVPFRGKRNEPAHVVRVAETVAEVKAASLAAVAEATSSNFHALFTP